MNKEALTTQLVCMLDVTSLLESTLVAEFKQHFESFFLTGEQRIELIAKVMDLDNEIGGLNFDIKLFQQTRESITNNEETQGTCTFLVKRKRGLKF